MGHMNIINENLTNGLSIEFNRLEVIFPMTSSVHESVYSGIVF